MADPYRPADFCQATKYAPHNMIRNGMRASNPFKLRTTSMEFAAKWVSAVRVAEKAIDLTNPSAFHSRNGMDDSRGMLMIHSPAMKVFFNERDS